MVIKCIKSIYICKMWVLAGFSAESEKICGCEISQILNSMEGYLQKKIQKLDVDPFKEEGKRFKFEIHLIIISRDR